MIYRIPKKARNKYGFVKGMSAGANMNNMSMALSISGGGGGGLGLSSVNANTIGSNPQIVSAINNAIQKMIEEGTLITTAQAEQMVDTKISEYDDSKNSGGDSGGDNSGDSEETPSE